MAKSLLAHLYSRISGSQEDVATISLHYLVSQSQALNSAFTKLLLSALKLPSNYILNYTCQSVGDNYERPDMVGIDVTNGTERIVCEMKFYAGLTDNQPIGYLDRIENNGGNGLVFICPKVRQTILWAKLLDICNKNGMDIQNISENYCLVNNIPMAIITWAEIISQLRNVANISAIKYLSDIHQLEGYCDQIDSNAFIPFSKEELSAETAKRNHRYYDVIDETVNLICADKKANATVKGKATSFKTGYERKIYINDLIIRLAYDKELWISDESVETPFWMTICNANDEQPQEYLNFFNQIKEEKKDNSVWKWTYIAIEPLTNSTLDEVCADIKCQILGYIDLFERFLDTLVI